MSEEEIVCRICFDETPDDPSLGRLFSPCRCKGTMKYVHTKCLQRWRETSQNNKSLYQCDQCHYKYRVGRVSAFYLVNNEVVLALASLLVFFCIVTVSGFLPFVKNPFLALNPIVGHFVKGTLATGFIGGFIVSILYLPADALFRLGFITRDRNSRLDTCIISVIIVIGIFWVFYKIYQVVREICRKIGTGIGDKILEVHE